MASRSCLGESSNSSRSRRPSPATPSSSPTIENDRDWLDLEGYGGKDVCHPMTTAITRFRRRTRSKPCRMWHFRSVEQGFGLHSFWAGHLVHHRSFFLTSAGEPT